MKHFLLTAVQLLHARLNVDSGDTLYVYHATEENLSGKEMHFAKEREKEQAQDT